MEKRVGGTWGLGMGTAALLTMLLLVGSALGGWQDDVRPKLVLDKEPEDTVTFSGNGTFTDFFKIFVQDGKYILVGARNAIYNLTASGLILQQKLEWYSEEEDVQMCFTKGKDMENCQNYIRVLKVVGAGKILVCGTNAYRPLCRYYHLTGTGKDAHYIKEERSDKSGQGVCPYDPRHNSTSILVDGTVYAGTVADFTEVDPLIHRWDQMRTRTPKYDLKSLNAPQFVNSMQFDDFVYFFFRETSEEFSNCGKAIFSRVGRVCKSDRGFPRNSQRWTTFFKAKLNCSIPGEFPFQFDEIQSMSSMLSASQLGTDVVYGVFNTGTNTITGSAVCAFKMRDILDVFDGRFKAQEKANMHWLPVPASRVPEPRPGSCEKDSTTLPEQYYMFVQSHTLMDESVQPLLSRPVLTRATQSYRLTTIAVHTNATGTDGQSYDVLFLGTDDGKVLTVVNVGREDVKTVVIQQVQVFKKPVREMLFLGPNSGKLLVGSDDNLKLLNMRQCYTTKIKSCGECVALQSPYCAWHKRENKCVNVPLDRPVLRRDYHQNVSSGTHSECGPKSGGGTLGTATSAPVVNPGDKGLGGGSSPSVSAQPKDTRSDGDVDSSTVIVGPRQSYTAETLSIAVGVGCVLAVLVGFTVGWGCAKRCRKDHDNIPYPDTDYEYFEQRHNLNINTRLVNEGKEEATYAEPVLDKPSANVVMPGGAHHGAPDHQETTMFHFAQPYARDLYRYEDDLNSSRGRPDAFGSLRPVGGYHPDNGYGTAHRMPHHQQPKPALPPINDGYGTARSVKKVYL